MVVYLSSTTPVTNRSLLQDAKIECWCMFLLLLQMSPEYHGFLKALQVAAAAQSVGAHVPSEMPPLPQLPRITVCTPQQQRKSEVSSQANTMTCDKKNGDEKK